MPQRVLVLILPGLSLEHFRHPDRLPRLSALAGEGELHRLLPVFPAVTLPVQASLTTGVWPESHGVVANGFFFPELRTVSFWEQASGLVQAERVWDRLRRNQPGLRTAALFLQNTLYAECDLLLTPKPVHEEEGLIPWCYARPEDLYETLCARLGPFPLHHYWGPLAGIDSTRWIVSAAIEVLARHRPDLLFVYLPHLDYAGQKFPPGDPRILEEVAQLDAEVGRLLDALEALGQADTALLVLAEYAFQEVAGDVPINCLLRQSGLLRTRIVGGREYPDMGLSAAFAMVDHQAAHLYVSPGHETAVRQLLERTGGIDRVLGPDDRRRYRLDHPRCGDLVAVSARDRWFSYGWWEEPERAPAFVSRVDIHRKPGYDPLELFGDPKTFRIASDTSLIRGSHGYPPESAADEVPLIISRSQRHPKVPEGCRTPDVTTLIERLLSTTLAGPI